jgi:DNA end-binding protein Ku
MARPYWSGQIQISLVSFGVKLFVATEAASEIHFHQIDRKTGERVRHQKVLASALEQNPDEGSAPVEKSSIVKGYEYSKGQYLQIEPEEIANLRVPSKHTMEITQFVDEADLPPEFFEKPYFVVPESDAQTEAFLTVRKALIDTKKLALSKIAFGGREHLVALAPAGTEAHGGMMAYTMRYAAELRNPAEYFRDIKSRKIDADSIGLAKELIKRKSGKFEPEKYKDGYEVALKELVDAKLKHLPIPQDEAPAPARGKVINLMDALRKSVAGGKAKEPEDVMDDDSESAKPGKKLTLLKGGKAAAKKAATKHPKRKTA